jgi:hypothetical protein
VDVGLLKFRAGATVGTNDGATEGRDWANAISSSRGDAESASASSIFTINQRAGIPVVVQHKRIGAWDTFVFHGL